MRLEKERTTPTGHCNHEEARRATRASAICSTSSQLGVTHPCPWGISLFDDHAVSDYGYCWLDVHNPAAVKDTIVAQARAILASGEDAGRQARTVTFAIHSCLRMR